jgi:hypothetical protein
LSLRFSSLQCLLIPDLLSWFIDALESEHHARTLHTPSLCTLLSVSDHRIPLDERPRLPQLGRGGAEELEEPVVVVDVVVVALGVNRDVRRRRRARPAEHAALVRLHVAPGGKDVPLVVVLAAAGRCCRRAAAACSVLPLPQPLAQPVQLHIGNHKVSDLR